MVQAAAAGGASTLRFFQYRDRVRVEFVDLPLAPLGGFLRKGQDRAGDYLASRSGFHVPLLVLDNDESGEELLSKKIRVPILLQQIILPPNRLRREYGLDHT